MSFDVTIDNPWLEPDPWVENIAGLSYGNAVPFLEDDAWTFTAVAARLGNANGAYRGPAGTALVFMTFGEIELKKP